MAFEGLAEKLQGTLKKLRGKGKLNEKDIKEAKNIAINMPRVSYQSKSLNKKTIFIASAIKSIFIIGSPSDSINNDKKLLVLLCLISLEPNFFLFSITSLSVSPLILYLFMIPP